VTSDRRIAFERFESALWNTSSLLVIDGDEALVVDPCISADEVERIRTRADEAGVRVTHILVTHGDWDHVCGIAAFPDATAAMGAGTAERIRSGEASRRMADAETGNGLAFAGEPRVDLVLEPGRRHELGPFAVETIALPGHKADSLGYRLRSPDVFAVGDHLSVVEFPFASDTAAYRATLSTLIELLQSDPPALVVPGHGPALTAEEALGVAQADLAYLSDLRDAVAAGGREAGLAVAPPRAAADDLASELEANVEAQLRELAAQS
jgi:glyoxylase-like metal-dependent hydrolase (beta-lactamase superfamily II)